MCQVLWKGAQRCFIEGIVAEGQGESPDGGGSALTCIAKTMPCPSHGKPSDTPESSTTVPVISTLNANLKQLQPVSTVITIDQYFFWL